MAREIDQVAGGREHVFATAHDFAADIGQDHFAGPPLDHGNTERSLKVPDLHRQRGLGHGASFGRAAKMAVFGQRRKILKLSKRNHPDQIN